MIKVATTIRALIAAIPIIIATGTVVDGAEPREDRFGEYTCYTTGVGGMERPKDKSSHFGEIQLPEIHKRFVITIKERDRSEFLTEACRKSGHPLTLICSEEKTIFS